MPISRLRKVGNSVGIILPKELLREKGLHVDDPVRYEVDRAATLEEVAGSLRKYGLSAVEWNDLTNEGEDL